MNFRLTIRLLLTFYRTFFIPSFLITLVCWLLFLEFGFSLFFILIGLKLSSMTLFFFFIRTYKKKEFYYYRNLGLSAAFLWTTTLLFDLLLYLLLLLQADQTFHMNHTLKADNIQLAFGPRRILSDIRLECSTGSITGLLGRNGAGKSCLLRAVYGDLPVTSRNIRFDGITVEKPYKHPGLLQFLPQFNFIPATLPLHRVLADFQLEYSDLEKKFPEFDKAHRSPIRQLSDGQQRLIQLYIIVRSASRFALLDEPFTHLMPLQIEKVKELLLEEKAGKGLLITDHLYRDVTAVSDRLYVLATGKTHPVETDQDIQRLGYLPPNRI